VEQFQKRTPASYDEFPVLTRDGRELWMGQNVQLLMKGSRVLGFQAVARDVTERKRAQAALERERQQLRDIVRHAPVAMAILDRDLRYLAHSRKWARLWGVEGQDFTGRAHQEMFPRLSPRYEDAVRRTLDEGGRPSGRGVPMKDRHQLTFARKRHLANFRHVASHGGAVDAGLHGGCGQGDLRWIAA